MRALAFCLIAIYSLSIDIRAQDNETVELGAPYFHLMETSGWDYPAWDWSPDSRRILKKIAQANPESWNAYDSSGEALMLMGRYPHAVTNLSKSLDLNPENQNARLHLNRIESFAQPPASDWRTHSPSTSKPGNDRDQPESIEFKSVDGFSLHGEYYSSGHLGPGILLVHMCNVGDRSSYRSLAKKLAERGLNVLTFDFRGHGESVSDTWNVRHDGDHFWENENGLIMEDIRAAYRQLQQKAEVERQQFGVMGASCSVKRVLRLATEHREIRALVLLSGDADQHGLNFLRTAPKLSVLGAAADDDGDGVASQWIRDILAASDSPNNACRFFQTGGHGTDLLESQRDLESEIVQWLKKVLPK